jgi:hypothetical protein
MGLRRGTGGRGGPSGYAAAIRSTARAESSNTVTGASARTDAVAPRAVSSGVVPHQSPRRSVSKTCPEDSCTTQSSPSLTSTCPRRARHSRALRTPDRGPRGGSTAHSPRSSPLPPAFDGLSGAGGVRARRSGGSRSRMSRAPFVYTFSRASESSSFQKPQSRAPRAAQKSTFSASPRRVSACSPSTRSWRGRLPDARTTSPPRRAPRARPVGRDTTPGAVGPASATRWHAGQHRAGAGVRAGLGRHVAV